jgi:hypothetical protein
MPWKNSWFQAAIGTALFSAALLASDILSSRGSHAKAGESSSTSSSSPASTPPAGSTPPVASTSTTSQAPVPGQQWTDSLDIVFRVVPGLNVLVADIDTRVSDFSAFCDATGYNAIGGMNVIVPGTIDSWQKPPDATWKNPGFIQTDDCPVTGVNWNDAQAFCDWLTKKERSMGLLTSKQVYRLPTNAEWSTAAESTVYPWGNDWPPFPKAGDYAGSEINTDRFIKGFYDGYPRTSPVGSFRSNDYALLDMGGDVWQWTMDWSDDQHTMKTMRGGSWDVSDPQLARSSYTMMADPGQRINDVGFRVVLDFGP